MSRNPASHRQDGSESGHWNKKYRFAYASNHHHDKQEKRHLYITTIKLLNRTSQQIQRLVDLLFDAKFDAEHGAIEREQGKTHLVANP